ncbi:MAG: hypothetical protein NPIRA02_10120 [Nitrospirales bacterium]|nr:MAG: hypothetical protein NPIRA02_10120 [Nitrospirales bacterium]
MGGISNIGPIFTQGDSSTATREFVELEQSGRLWVGRPSQHSLIAMIALYAPGLDNGHVILRELTTAEGHLTILLTAPDAIRSHVQRVTLYTKELPETITLHELVDGQWQKRLPQSLMIDSLNKGKTVSQELKAFSVKTLGFYWVLESTAQTATMLSASVNTSARTLIGGDLAWGFMPSLLGILLLMVCGAVSRYVHKTAKLREL